MRRMDQIERLQREEFDLCIIGGGAAGAGAALDAALRGLKVALIEKSDFAGETSSKSTKLIHGGVRYLEQAIKKFDWAQLRQVRHGLQERHLVITLAPHLARPLGLLTPVYSWWEGLYYFIGLRLYDWFAARKDHLPKGKWLNKAQTLELAPELSRQIHGAIRYFDGQLNDARYCLALVQSAVAEGASAANYLEAIGFETDSSGRLTALQVNDRTRPAAFSIRAKRFLNCCGPYSDHIRHMANPRLSSRILPSKGVHLVLPRTVFTGEHALLIPKTKDGRVVFVIPFAGNILLGTTDQPWEQGETEPMLEAAEVDFLLETLQPFLDKKLDNSAVKAGFGALRPLILPRETKAMQSKSMLRDHEVEYDPDSGLFSLLGGKWTTYRIMAKDAVDAVCKLEHVAAKCSTDSYPLIGAQGWDINFWKKIAAVYAFDADVSQHLAANYGSEAEKVAHRARQQPDWRERLLPGQPFIKAEIAYAVEHEMAVSIRDFLARRIRLEIMDWSAAAAAAGSVAETMGALLGWSPEKQLQAAQEYRDLIRNFQANAAGKPTNPL